MIDIVVSYVDQSDPEWFASYSEWKAKELGDGAQDEGNRQAFDPARFRDWDNFRYWFRGVERNCPWVNNVFLVVASESQVPKWLDRSNPKLKVVTHDEFIPKELLPTFSILPIEMFYYRIDGLSDTFVTCNDDFFFLNPTPSDRFFGDDGKIHQWVKEIPLRYYEGKYDGDHVWDAVVDNCNRMLNRYSDRPIAFQCSHLPEPRSKSFEKGFMEEHYDEIVGSFHASRFRHRDNYMSWLFIDMMKLKATESYDSYANSLYVQMDSTKDVDSYANLEMVCFNDTPAMDDFVTCRDRVLALLERKFPRPCSFEVEYSGKPKALKKVFGVVSYVPDSARELREERITRMFNQVRETFGNDVDFLVIAQNWKDYRPPEGDGVTTVIRKPKLGILGARKALRQEFLKSDYDYLIMCDDDLLIETSPGFDGKNYMEALDEHPDGFMFIKRRNGTYRPAQLNLCAISRHVYAMEPMVDVNPQLGEGYEDFIFANLLHCKYPELEFDVSGIWTTQLHNPNEKAPSTWWDGSMDNDYLYDLSVFHIRRFRLGKFDIDKAKAKKYVDVLRFADKAKWNGWMSQQEIDRMLAEYLE